MTKFQVHLTFRIQPDAYDPEHTDTPVQQQADEMANAVVGIIRGALAKQDDALPDLIEISARGVV